MARWLAKVKGVGLKRSYLRIRRFVMNHVLHAGDSPHKVALGAALAMFVSLFPLIGCQTAAAVGLAALFRANKAICVPVVWFSNPFTIVPIYAASLFVGQALLQSNAQIDLMTALATLGPPDSWAGLLTASYWSAWFTNLLSLGVELWVGMAIVGAALGAITYVATRWLVIVYRRRRHQRLTRRALFRAPRCETLAKVDAA